MIRAGGWIPWTVLVCSMVAPAGAHAGWLGVRNDLTVPVVIRGGVVVNNQPRFGKPLVLQPGEVIWDAVLVPGVRVIEIYDPKQLRIPLMQAPVRCMGNDLFFSIAVDPRLPAKVALVPTKPPMKPGAKAR